MFGKDSTQARKVVEAFDAVGSAAPETPDPTPVPVVQGPDASLFRDAGSVLRRVRDVPLGDGAG